MSRAPRVSGLSSGATADQAHRFLCEGQWLYGLIGPVVFLAAALAAALLWTGALEQLDGRAMPAVALGGPALLIGVAAARFLISRAQARSATFCHMRVEFERRRAGGLAVLAILRNV